MSAIKQTLLDMRSNLEPLLGTDTDKFIQIADNFVAAKPKLLEADRPSLLKAITDAAQAHLFIDGQECSLVPYKGVVKYSPGYKGLLKLARNSGELAAINAAVVYKTDAFEYSTDELGEHIKHQPNIFVTSKDRGAAIATYCIARTKDKGVYVEVMTEEEIQSCKKVSPSARMGDSPWDGPFADEMRKKTVFRRISKRLPSSTDLAIAIHADDELFNPEPEPEKEPEPAPTTSAKLNEAIKAQEAEPVKTPLSVQGLLAEVKVLENAKVNGKVTPRHKFCVLGEWYGTFNPVLAEKAKTMVNTAVWLIYEERETKDKKPYFEILDIKPAVEEDPI